MHDDFTEYSSTIWSKCCPIWVTNYSFWKFLHPWSHKALQLIYHVFWTIKASKISYLSKIDRTLLVKAKNLFQKWWFSQVFLLMGASFGTNNQQRAQKKSFHIVCFCLYDKCNDTCTSPPAVISKPYPLQQGNFHQNHLKTPQAIPSYDTKKIMLLEYISTAPTQW